MGAGGVIVPPETYFPKLHEICDRYDVLLIADEVITGFGRTGRWFGLEHWGVEPDIVTFAKGITSGYFPLGGVGLSDRVAAMDQRGVITRIVGDVILLAPPFVATEQEIDRMVAVIEESIPSALG